MASGHNQLSALFPEPITGAIDPDDPAFDYVLHAIGHLRAAGLDTTDPEILALAVVGGRNLAHCADEGDTAERVAEQQAEAARHDDRMARLIANRSVVYYARLGNRVKIGYTADLGHRMNSIQPEEVLATERGGPKLETKRHAQFAKLRVVGEWFRYEQPLVDHIAALPPLPPPEPARLPPGRGILSREW